MTLYSLALARAPHPDAVVAPDGAYAELADDGISFFDPAGRLLIRYEDGNLTVCPPKGDLVLGSATGAVRIAAASDVVIEAKRDVALSAPRSIDLRNGEGTALSLDPKRATILSSEIVIDGRKTKLIGEVAEIAVERIGMTAKDIVSTADRIESAAVKTVLRTREMVEEVTGVLTQRLGRFRGVVREAYALRTGRTDLRSKDDTSIDGKRVLLG